MDGKGKGKERRMTALVRGDARGQKGQYLQESVYTKWKDGGVGAGGGRITVGCIVLLHLMYAPWRTPGRPVEGERAALRAVDEHGSWLRYTSDCSTTQGGNNIRHRLYRHRREATTYSDGKCAFGKPTTLSRLALAPSLKGLWYALRSFSPHVFAHKTQTVSHRQLGHVQELRICRS